MSRNKSMHSYCPQCGECFLGERLSERDSAAFGGIKYLSRILNVSILRKHEIVLMWQCPDCGFEWSRASEPANPGVFKKKEILRPWPLQEASR